MIIEDIEDDNLIAYDKLPPLGIIGKSVIPISDGISKFKIPQMYTKLLAYELERGSFLNFYSNFDGLDVLKENILFYENIIGSGDIKRVNKYFKNICISIGASSAIAFLMDYIYNNSKEPRVLMLGLNYYLFYEWLKKYKIFYKTILSSNTNEIIPTVHDVIKKIEEEKYKFVCLTIPMNPSGEIYDEKDLLTLIKYAANNDIYLIIDKCQIDELSDNVDIIPNINKIIFDIGYNKFIIINSFSKTRYIPGARIGYIIANENIIDHVSKMTEMVAFNAPLPYVTAIIFDLLFRAIRYYNENKDSKKIIIKSFKLITMNSLRKDIYESLFSELFEDNILLENYYLLKNEIDENRQKILNNYNFLINILGKFLLGCTNLSGGFNFAIKIFDATKRRQINFVNELIEGTDLFLQPELMFNGNKVLLSDDFAWFRISCAHETEIFAGYIDKLYKYLLKTI